MARDTVVSWKTFALFLLVPPLLLLAVVFLPVLLLVVLWLYYRGAYDAWQETHGTDTHGRTTESDDPTGVSHQEA